MITINSMPYNKIGAGPVYESEEERRLWKAALGDYIRKLNFELVSGLDFNYSFDGGLIGGTRFEASGIETYFGTPQVYNQYLYLVVTVDNDGQVTNAEIVNQQNQGYTENYDFEGLYSVAIFEVYIPANSTQIIETNFTELVVDIALLGSDINTIEEELQYKETVYSWEEYKEKYNVSIPTTFTSINANLKTKEKIVDVIPIEEIVSSNLPQIIVLDNLDLLVEIKKYALGYSKMSIVQVPTTNEPLGFDSFCYSGWTKLNWLHVYGTRVIAQNLATASNQPLNVAYLNNWLDLELEVVNTNVSNTYPSRYVRSGLYIFYDTVDVFIAGGITTVQMELRNATNTEATFVTNQLVHAPVAGHDSYTSPQLLKTIVGKRYKEI